MDALIGEYASDNEDSAEQTPSPVQVKQKAAELAPAKRTLPPEPPQQNGQKRRKVLDISILPIHIQKALVGDAGDMDSDDDKPANFPVLKTQTSHDKRNSSSDPLLAILPPPEHEKVSPFDQPLFSAPSISQPSLRRQFTSEFDVHPSPPSRFDAVSTEEIIGPAYSDDDGDIEGVPDRSNMSELPKDRRKQQREIEQMLLSGDVSALQDAGTSFREIRAPGQWDAASYTEQKQKEAAIIKQYTADGALKSAVQPTRLQNRRHQITSLAMKAAETEIALLEARDSRGKSKSQSKSKYGW